MNFQRCLKQKCWHALHAFLVQVTQKPTHGNKYTTKMLGWPKGRWSHWPAIRKFMDYKHCFECSFGFFGVMCSIIPKNMFKWLQCVWNFLFIWQAMWNYLSIHKMSPLVSFSSSSPLTTKTYKVTKTITNQVWKWFWLPESITNTNSGEQESLRLNLRHNFSIDISMILLRMKKNTLPQSFSLKNTYWF